MSVEYKRPLGELNSRHGRHGEFPGDVPAVQLLDVCKKEGDAVWNTPPRHRTARHLRKESQQVEYRPSLVDQQVSPADLAALRGRPDPGGDVANVDEVEVAVEVTLDAAVAEVADQSRGRAEVAIAGADGDARPDDDDGVAGLGGLAGSLFGAPFTATLGTEHVAQRRPRVLGDDPLATRRRKDRLGGDIHRPAGAGGTGRSQHVTRPLVVDLFELIGITRPEVRVGGEMQDDLAALRDLLHGRGIADVCEDDLDVVLGQMRSRYARLLQDTHRVILGHELLHEVGADEAGPAGYQHCPGAVDLDRSPPAAQTRCCHAAIPSSRCRAGASRWVSMRLTSA